MSEWVLISTYLCFVFKENRLDQPAGWMVECLDGVIAWCVVIGSWEWMVIRGGNGNGVTDIGDRLE